MSRRRVVAILLSGAVVASGLGYAVADAYDVVPGVLTVEPPPAPPSPPPAPPGAGDLAAATTPVLPPAGPDAPVPDPAVLAETLDPLLAEPALGGSASAVVVDALTGTELYQHAAAAPREPASVAKLLTGAAALSRLGAGSTVATRAVTGAAADEVVLLGGGDVLLSAGSGQEGQVRGHAGLADLAQQAADSLLSQGRTAVAVRVDDSLFSPERMGPGWRELDLRLGYVAPVTAVAVDAGRTTEEPYAPRRDEPALHAGQVFAQLLASHGVQVVGSVARAVAPPEPEVLGEVRSAPLADVVGYMLQSSDNNVAEALARLVAVDMGRATTFSDSAQAVLDEVALAGVDVGGATLADGSGLSDGSALPVPLLADVLTIAASPDRQDLRPLLTGLPVAGLDGTLTERFAGADAEPGLGTVRAKTGSLSGVTSLAGTVTTSQGRLLAFAMIADGVPATGPAREVLDQVASRLAACGCGGEVTG